jgi:L-alanine-DL-glutamate epimerase-like enolase superfamily enzyme
LKYLACGWSVWCQTTAMIQPYGNAIESMNVSVYRVPTDYPESDGTLEWNDTTMILVDVGCQGLHGIGYTYGHQAIAGLIMDKLRELVIGKDCLQVEFITDSMIKSIRNEGSCGMAYMALSAVDIALWDLKAGLLGLPLASLLGMVNDRMLIYGSGGFTSYNVDQIRDQFAGWAERGIKHMKMKVGRVPEDDPARVKAAKAYMGPGCTLFVDANGAYSVKQSLQMAEKFNAYDVTWFEEPVSSDNLTGLGLIRKKVPAGMNISAGEYGYNLPYFCRMIEESAVDILQADITRCGGVTGFMKIGHLCEAHQIPFSSHCAPALHIHAALSLPAFYIGEYFHDHARIEHMFFDGFAEPVNGYVSPDLSAPGLGLVLKSADVRKYKLN